jgi:hypothetical protein
MNRTSRPEEAVLPPIAEGRGLGIATNRITGEGQPVGHMYREERAFAADSGWRFTAGDEDEAYASDPDQWGVVDINVIANCDREIVAFLDAPVGSRAVRWPAGTPLRLNPTSPAEAAASGHAASDGAGAAGGETATGAGEAVAEGTAGTGTAVADGEAPLQRQALGSDWWIDLPGRFAAGMVNNAIHLVATRAPMRTIWVDIWTPPVGDGGAAGRLAADLRAAARPSGAREFEEPGSEPGEIRIGYWYQEAAGAEGGPRHWTLYAYTIRPASFVQAVFMSASPDPEWALAAWRSLRSAPPT